MARVWINACDFGGVEAERDGVLSRRRSSIGRHLRRYLIVPAAGLMCYDESQFAVAGRAAVQGRVNVAPVRTKSLFTVNDCGSEDGDCTLNV